MCNRFGTLSRVALLLAVIGTAADPPTSAQAIGTQQIPPDTPDDVREQIERLLSDDLTDCIDAVRNLGKMGGRATPAVPSLLDFIRVISDLEHMPPERHVELANEITLGREALQAIGEIANLQLNRCLRLSETDVSYATGAFRWPLRRSARRPFSGWLRH